MSVDWHGLAPWLLAALGLLVLGGFFAGTEVAMFGLRRVEREQLARSGRRVDAIVLRLLSQPRRLVTTVLLGSEAVSTSVAAIAVVVFAELVPDAGPALLVALAVAGAAPLVLLVGVVVPRTLAIKAPIGWARSAARPLAAIALLLSPLRVAVQAVSDTVARALGGGGRARGAGELSEEEFRKLVDAGSAQGQVDARERRLIHKVFEFGDKNVGQIMTPRDKVFALAYDVPMARLVKEVAARGFSRVPIYQRSLDNVRGILNAKDLVLATAGQAPARILSELLHEPLFVPRTTPLARLFRTFKQRKVHMALVVSEYGSLLGLVTMEDLLEQLFGEIRDERETLQAGVLRRGRGGRTPVPGTVPAVTGEAGAEAAPIRGDDLTPPPVEEPLPPRAGRATGVLAMIGSGDVPRGAGALAAAVDEPSDVGAAPAGEPPPADAIDEPPPEITKPFDLEDLADDGAEAVRPRDGKAGRR